MNPRQSSSRKSQYIALLFTTILVVSVWLISVYATGRSQGAVDKVLQNSLLVRLAKEGTINLTKAEVLRKQIESEHHDLKGRQDELNKLGGDFLAITKLINNIGLDGLAKQLCDTFIEEGRKYYQAAQYFIPIKEKMLFYSIEYDGKVKPLSEFLVDRQLRHILYVQALHKSVEKGEVLVSTLYYINCGFYKWHTEHEIRDSDIAEIVYAEMDPLHQDLHNHSAAIAEHLDHGEVEQAREILLRAEDELDRLGKYFNGIRLLAEERYGEVEAEFNKKVKEIELDYANALTAVEHLVQHLQQVDLSASMTDMNKTVSMNRSLIWIFSALSALLAISIALFTFRRIVQRTIALETSNQELSRAKQELEISNQFSKTVLNSMKDAICTINIADFSITAANAVFLDEYGFTEAEVIGKKCYEITHNQTVPCTPPQDPCPLHNLIGKTDKHAAVEHVHFCKGSKSMVEVSVSLFNTNDDRSSPCQAIHISRDITSRKEAEAAILKAKLEAERNKLKSDFLANMSHEIRTPMNAIIGMSGLALHLELTPKLRDYLTTIRTSAYSLLRIINDILDFSKIEADKLTMESVPFRLDEVIETQLDMFGVQAAAKDIEIFYDRAADVPDGLIGDPLRLGQILTNLINNALKFTPKGEVLIEVRSLHKTPDTVRLHFSVKDSGIGIGKDQVKELFSAFTQADSSTTRKYGGSGLGLAISKRLVEMMAGEIWVDSEPGMGSTFHFTAEFHCRFVDDTTKPVMPDDLLGLRVLVIDENVSSRRIMEQRLAAFGLVVQTVASARVARERLEQGVETNQPFQLVLAVWKNEGVDGAAIAAAIKKEPRLQATKVIIVTPFQRQTDRKYVKAAGASAMLRTPVKPSLLFNTILEVFGHPALITSNGLNIDSATGAHSEKFLPGHTVLLVEDNIINQRVAVAILANMGIAAEIAGNGEEAITAVREKTFDAVLMDVQMPGMDGYEATRAIRQIPGCVALPIIAMTANAMTGDREKCIAAGMNDYASKPIDPPTFFSTLKKWIKPRTGGIADLPAPATRQRQVPAASNEVPTCLPGFDIKEGVKRLGGSVAFLVELVRDFVDNHADTVNAIREAMARGDRKKARLLAHTLKGMAGNLSAHELHAAARDLENAIKEGNIDEMESLFVGTEVAIGQFLKSARIIIKGHGTAEMSAQPFANEKWKWDPQQAQAMFTNLDAFLEKMDPVGTEKAMQSLTHYFAGSAHAENIAMLEKDINTFDYDNARKTLTAVAAAIGESEKPSPQTLHQKEALASC